MTEEDLNESNEIEIEVPEEEGRSAPESVEESARLVREQLEAKPEETLDEPAEAKPEVEATAQEKADEEVRARDESGKFIKKGATSKKKIIQAADLDIGKKQKMSPDGMRQHSAEPVNLQSDQRILQKERLDPPAMWPLPDKEWFNSQPETVQKNALAWFKNSQAGVTKVVQEYRTKAQGYAQIDKLHEEYRSDWPAHATKEAVVAELFETARRIRKDPYGALTQTMVAAGIQPQQMLEYWQKGQAPTNGAQQNQGTQNNALLPDEIRAIMREELQQTRSQQQEAAETQEVEQIRNERDAAGKYLYPELWDANNPNSNYWNESYLADLDPLVGRLQRSKGLSVAAATKEAIKRLRLLDGNPPTSSANGARLSPQEIKTLKDASVSTKSRGNGAIATNVRARKGETVAQSAEIVWNQLTQGKH